MDNHTLLNAVLRNRQTGFIGKGHFCATNYILPKFEKPVRKIGPNNRSIIAQQPSRRYERNGCTISGS